MPGLSPFIDVLLCVCAAALGAWSGRRAHRREALSDASHILKHSPHLWLILVLPVALLAYHLTLVVKPALEWSLPYEMQYYYGPVAWSILIGCFTYFVAFGAVIFHETKHPKRKPLGFAMLLLFVAIQEFHWQAIHPLRPELGKPRTAEGGMIFQTSPDTCVPAASGSLLRVLGDPHSEAEMVRLLGTDTAGTLPSQLVMAMRSLGYSESTVDIDREGIDAIQTPAVIFLRHNSHAITLLRVDGEYGYIWDPLHGPVIMSYAGLRLYLGGAHAIHFEKSGSGPAKKENENRGGI
ncbi:hypothetical protein GC207_12560 [bacterium]|nr:hypothetical protein [bacterium]